MKIIEIQSKPYFPKGSPLYMEPFISCLKKKKSVKLLLSQ